MNLFRRFFLKFDEPEHPNWPSFLYTITKVVGNISEYVSILSEYIKF